MNAAIILDIRFRWHALVLMILCSIGTVLPIRAQKLAVKTDTQQGIALYEQNRAKDAINLLKRATKSNSNDADAWHFLGLAYFKLSQNENARKAFEKAINLRPNFTDSHTGLGYMFLVMDNLKESDQEAANALRIEPDNVLAHYIKGTVALRQRKPTLALSEIETAVRLDPKLSAAYLVKSEALVALFDDDSSPAMPDSKVSQYRYLTQAADALEEYFKLNPNESRSGYWAEQLATLRQYRDYSEKLAGNNQNSVFTSTQVAEKARILSKPAPEYTKLARSRGDKGTVRLNAVLAFDGKVRNILALNSLGGGLTEQAIDAAKRIRFLPALIDGRPVSQYIVIEYHFNIY